MAQSWPITVSNFSGAKFATRYNLDGLAGDFWVLQNQLYIKDGIVLPDNPPIMEAVSPPTDQNAGLKAALDAVIADTTNTTLATKVKAVMTEWRKKL